MKMNLLKDIKMVVNKHKDIIINKYTEYDEDERLVSDRGHNVEYLTTMRYIQKFLKPLGANGGGKLDFASGGIKEINLLQSAWQSFNWKTFLL